MTLAPSISSSVLFCGLRFPLLPGWLSLTSVADVEALFLRPRIKLRASFKGPDRWGFGSRLDHFYPHHLLRLVWAQELGLAGGWLSQL